MQPLPQHAHHGIEPVALSCEPVEMRRGCGRCERNDMLVDDSGDDDDTLPCVVVVRSAELPAPAAVVVVVGTIGGLAAAIASKEGRRKLNRRLEMVAVAGALTASCWPLASAVAVILLRRICCADCVG